MKETHHNGKNSIFIAQLTSLTLIWVFVIAIGIWIINLIIQSIELSDALGATLVISIIAIPIFLTLAGILTYVFIGLHKEERLLIATSLEE